MNLRKAFYYDGRSSLDFGLYISGDQTFNAPEKKIKKVSVPGRNGDLIFFDGSYNNHEYKYNAFLINDLNHRSRNFKSWILSRNGYCRLEDDYHPEEFKMAQFKGPIDFDVTLLTAGQTTLTFDCKPQRYLKIGETALDMSAGTTRMVIYNPTYFKAKPLIKVGGSGTGTIKITNGDGDVQDITIADLSTTTADLYIDSEIEQAYLASSNTYFNSHITLSTNEYPYFLPGNNTITTTGSIYLIIIPRWFML